jgi:molybdopterin converting factor subunit 1
MNIRVRMFASFREAVGSGDLPVTLPDKSSVTELIAQLETRYPSIRVGLETGMVAVNHEYVGRDVMLSDGDEVALIPPVSGGQ